MAGLESLYENFRFVPGHTPVSDLRSVIIASGSYIVIVYALQALMNLRYRSLVLPLRKAC